MSHGIRQIRIVAVLCISGVLFTVAAGAAGAAADAAARRQREAELIKTLKGDAAQAAKDKACRELQVIGTPACIDALAALLPDEKLSHMARYALEPMQYPQAARALRDALGKTSGATKVGVITSLGFREDTQAVGQLVKLLADRDTDIISAAAAALGRIGTPEAARALDKFRAGAAKPLRAVAAEASLTAAERLVRQGLRDQAATICEDLQDARWPAHVRLGAFVGLLSVGGDEAVARAVAAIAGNDPAIRSVAIANITALKGPGVGRRLAAELPKLPPQAQVLLIGALAGRGDADVRPAIVKAASGSNPKVRIAALEALGKVGDAACVAVLCKAVAEGKSDAEKQAAVNSLWILPGRGVNAALLTQMKAAPPAARAKLIGVLVARKATDAVAGLLREAASPDAGLRAAAFKALGQLAGPKDLRAVLRLLVGMRGEAARTEAERAVVHVARKIADEAVRADAALAALKAAVRTPARCSLLRALGGIGNAKAFEAVRTALADKTPAVQDAALRTLVDWPDARALEALLGVFRTTDNRIHRILALRGCVRILGLGGRPAAQTLKSYQELMKAAKRPDDRKLVLAGLATVADPAAVGVVEPYLTDPQVGPEAELAMLSIARGMMGTASKQAKAVAARLKATSKSQAVRDEADRIIRQSDRFGDYIVAWQVAGPYPGGAAKFDTVLPPEKGPKGVTWRKLPLPGRTAKPWMLDLQGAVGGEDCLAYVRTWIHSGMARPARLEMGVDDGIKAWLNGKVVHANNSAGAAIAGEEKAKVSLKEGWNLLLLKVIQHTGPWEFCARLRAPDGGPLAGLNVDSAREPTTAKSAAGPTARPKVFVSQGTVQALFNGKDLTGWSQTGSAIFTVADGNLVGTQTTGKGGDLWTKADFDNFELHVTYRVGWPANSGFWFRHNGKRGYQYDVLKYKNPVAFSGTLYCPGKMFIIRNLNESLEKRDGWNEARVRAAGDEMTLWLNGTKTGTVRDNTLSKGKIGIQVHPGNGFKGMKIVIKKMEVRLLKAQGGS